MKYDVCGLGNALLDIEVNVSDKHLEKLSIDKGLMTLIDEKAHQCLLDSFAMQPQVRACGGSAANTMIALQQLGGQGYYSCKVANDDGGAHFIEDLLSHGVHSNLSPETLEPGVTGKCLAMVTPDAERTMSTHLGITELFSVRELNETAIKASQYLYIEGYLVASNTARHAAIEARKIAEASGVKTAITLSDPNMTQYFAEGLNEIIGRQVDLLFCNEQEALYFSGVNDLNDALPFLKKKAKTFVVTQGKKGALLFDGAACHHLPESPATVVDTLGAGDMFAGSYLASISKGESPILAARKANLAAAKVVSKFGPRLGDEEAGEVCEQLKILNTIQSIAV
jgi:sugar/nucleoside kinase (ribokinase family)